MKASRDGSVPNVSWLFLYWEKNMKKSSVRDLVTAALLLAVGLTLPFLTGQIPQVGNMLLPMHIPVLLCGFICGPWWGLAVGVVCPVLRSLILTMPPMFPKAIGMAVELGTYGAVSGALYRILRGKKGGIYITLFVSMLAGRILWGAARFLMAVGTGSTFPMSAFIAGAVTEAIPGIILQIIAVPLLVMAAERKK